MTECFYCGKKARVSRQYELQERDADIDGTYWIRLNRTHSHDKECAKEALFDALANSGYRPTDKLRVIEVLR